MAERYTAPLGRRWTWRETSAVAAALFTGILIGPDVLKASQPLPLISDGGRVVAIGALDAALDSASTGVLGKDASGTLIGVTVRSNTGSYCRSFATLRGPAGLACRERGDWVVEVLARNPRPRDGSAPDNYRQAGVPFPEIIRLALINRQSGAPLTRDAEAALIASRWRSESVLKATAP